MKIFRQSIYAFILVVASVGLMFSSCTNDVLDYEHPEVKVFVEQLKSGNLAFNTGDEVDSMPKFTWENIEELLEYADDVSVIPAFPLAPVSYSAGGKLRLGECVLWTIETIRLGHNASMGCKMVHVDAENYEGIYFLTDDEIRDAAERYRCWWEMKKFPRTVWTIDPCYDEPLCGSGYMWW